MKAKIHQVRTLFRRKLQWRSTLYAGGNHRALFRSTETYINLPDAIKAALLVIGVSDQVDVTWLDGRRHVWTAIDALECYADLQRKVAR